MAVRSSVASVVSPGRGEHGRPSRRTRPHVAGNGDTVDITDHYAFQKPDHPDRTILILNVNPLAPAHAAEFRADAVYETLVDTNGDAQPVIVFQYLFTAKNDRGDQFATVLRTDLAGVGPHARHHYIR